METPDKPQSRTRYLLRVLRPLFLWFGLVLILFGIHEHQIWIEKTRVYFNVVLKGPEPQPAYFPDGTPFAPVTTVDGRPVMNGDKIGLGKHQFRITTPKTQPFSTNLSIWYGPHDLGTIALTRATGILSVTAAPPARVISIRGPEYNIILTNSSGIVAHVPTDQYAIAAQYDHWSDNQQAKVYDNLPGIVQILPKFGALEMSCNQVGATFQLNRSDGDLVQSGELPITITDLPAEGYRLLCWHHNHEWKQYPQVNVGVTNTCRIDFQYGTAIVESSPSGATVTTTEGRNLGTTPLTLTELQPGALKLNLQLYNYEQAKVFFQIAANETNTVHTNLISQSYTSAMRIARQLMKSGKYDEAVASLNDALRVQSGDPVAASLRNEALGQASMSRAAELGNQGDFIAAINELTNAFAALPESQKPKQMLVDFKKRLPEQMERLREERLALPKKTFDEVISETIGANLFQYHELTTAKPAPEVLSGIVTQLKSTQPPFRINRSDLSTNGLFRIDAIQEFSGGSRQCLIAGGQSKDDETQIYFTVMESKKLGFMQQPITSLMGATPLEYTIIDPNQSQLGEKQKAQIAEGQQLVTERIQRAIGQSASN